VVGARPVTRTAIGENPSYLTPFWGGQGDGLSLSSPSRMLRLRAARSLLSSELEVKVSDTGIGIPESALPRLFDRFYRVDQLAPMLLQPSSVETPAGSGLGLAIAQAIVENPKAKFRPKAPLIKAQPLPLPYLLSFEVLNRRWPLYLPSAPALIKCFLWQMHVGSYSNNLNGKLVMSQN